MFYLLRKVEKQTNNLKLVKKNLNKYLTIIVIYKERYYQYNTIIANNTIKLIIAKNYKTIVFVYI